MKKDNVVGFDQVESNARRCSYHLSKGTGKELYIGTKKSIDSKVRFVQILQNNWNYLRQRKYLTGEEKVFLDN